MGSMTKLMVVVFLLHVIMVATGISDPPLSGLYTLLTQPQNWTINSFLGFLDDLMLIGGTSLILISGFFRNDLLTFGSLSAIILSFGSVFYELWNLINASWGTEAATIIVSPLILIYIMTTVAWLRGLKT